MPAEKSSTHYFGRIFLKPAVVIAVILTITLGPFMFNTLHIIFNNTEQVRVHCSETLSCHPPKATNPPTNFTWKLAFEHLGGRLGNQMFELASSFGIAQMNGRLLLVNQKFAKKLQRYFPAVQMIPKENGEETYRTISETRGYAIYDSRFEVLPDKNYRVFGYLQSWRYFINSWTEIRALYRFSSDIERNVYEFFQRLAKGSDDSSVTNVGIHVRRGDIIHKSWLITPGRSYILKAMQYFRDKYKRVRFIVCSNDLKWCRKNLGDQMDVTFYDRGNSPAQDMAILAHCHHTVMTVGSFGWWASWLANGTTVYYGKPSVSGTNRAKKLKQSDAFLPKWVPMLD